MDRGYNTEKLGKKLAQVYRGSNYEIFFSHGSDKELNFPNLCHPTPFFDDYSPETSLSIVDIAILNRGTRNVEIIIEIEESGASPKIVIGDVMNLIFSNNIRIHGENYSYNSPLVFIFGAKAKRNKKTQRLFRELREINKILGKKIILIDPFLDNNIENLLKLLEIEIIKRCPPEKRD